MEILVLGTSASKPLPREGCRCPICVSKDKKDRRMRPSILINNKFLIDCGPDILKQIKNLSPSLRLQPEADPPLAEVRLRQKRLTPTAVGEKAKILRQSLLPMPTRIILLD